MLENTHPVSFGQRGQHYVHEVRGAKQVYQDFAVFRLFGTLDLPAFRSAVETLVERHAMLRTRFASVDGELRQVVDPEWRGTVSVEQAAAETEPAAAIEAYIEKLAAIPLDLEEGPLFSVGILDVGDGSQVVAFVKHRMIADCRSLELLFEELSSLYGLTLAGSSIDVPAPAPLHDKFVLWQHSPQARDEFDDLLTYWTRHIGDAPRNLELGRTPEPDRSGEEPQSVGELEFRIPDPSFQQLLEFTSSCNATLYMTLLAAFQMTVAAAAQSRDFLIGVPVAGRTDIDLEEAIGYFVNLLALRADLSDDPTGTELVRRVRKALLGGMANQDLPFELLLDVLGERPTAQRHPLVQATMQLIAEGEAEDLRLEGLKAEPVAVSEYQIAFDLTLNLYVGEESLRGRLIYTPDAVHRAVAETAVEQFCRLIEVMPANPDATVSELMALSDH